MNTLKFIQSNEKFKLLFNNDYQYKTYYIKLYNNKNIWKIFGNNYYDQYHISKEVKYIFKPTTFFEGEIYDLKFHGSTIIMKTFNDKNEIVWKSFGDNRCGQCGVNKEDLFISKPTTFFEGEIYKWKFGNSTVFIKTNNIKGKTIWKSFGKNKYGQCGVGKEDKYILKPTTFFKGDIYTHIYNNKTNFIKTNNIKGKTIWKSFGYNEYGQCGVGKEDKYILKPTTFFEGEINKWKFYDYTNFIEIIDNKGKKICKSFGYNEYGQCGVGKEDKYILEPTTFFEGEIYLWMYNNNTVYIKTINNKGETIWKSFGNNKHLRYGGKEDKYILEPTTFFEGEIYLWQFIDDIIYIKTIDNKGEMIWKSFNINQKDKYISKIKTSLKNKTYKYIPKNIKGDKKNKHKSSIKSSNNYKNIWKSFVNNFNKSSKSYNIYKKIN